MMEGETKQHSPWIFTSSNEAGVDSQYLCQFTMLLMDTVEELAVRVSQIDFVCRQHFPDLQTLSQSIQKKIIGTKKAELEWRKREDSLLQKIQELQSDIQHSQEQIKQLNRSLEECRHRYEFEKKELLDQLKQKADEGFKAREIKEDLLQQVKLKDQQVEAELRKRKSLLEDCNILKTNYKHLKSQYNFLLSKLDNGSSLVPDTYMEVNLKGTSTSCQKKRYNEDMKNNVQESSPHASKLNKIMPDMSHQPKEGSVDISIEIKKGSMKHCLIPSKATLNVEKEPSCSTKQAAPRWRGTRTCQEPGGGGDPHDDFLDTPIENARNANNNPATSDDVVNDICLDEKKMNGNHPEFVSRKCPILIGGSSKKGYKYVEPVRKRAERENLKGVECQQCRKFYDAVLPDGGDKAVNTMRCEHHEGVSRHRYRYAPPLTPEGFWNIGFDSEL